jgi:tetratricopeptide (TPR) repeat protein
MVAQEQGQYAEAATYYQQSLVLYREIGDRVGEADSLFRLGYVAHEQEQYAEAEGYYLQCLPIYQELGDSHDEAATLNNLGVVAADQERYAEAEHLYQQSLAIYQEIGEHHDAANTLNNLGNATRAQERYAEAEEYYLQSLALYREVGDLQSQAKVLNNLGDVVEAQGRYAEAEEYYRQSREVSQGGAGDAQGVGTDSAAASSPASTDERCFAETGYCIAGAIRTYWEQQGGLAVFGYPITAQREETIEGATLSVQWFERDRLEDHGAAGVMAGRLGAAMLAQRGTPWESYPQVETAAEGCHYFAETGHSLCEPFLSHWQQQGGLQRFGYPLTEPQQETIGDWTGTVQYFERRRMEHHAENPQPYDMLLGLLGSEVQER